MQEKYLPVLKKSPLFAAIAPTDIPELLQCLGARTCTVAKNQAVFAQGAPAREIGMVLCGSVHVEKADYWGNRSILAQIGPGELFGETFGFAGVAALPVEVVAAEPGEVVLLQHQRIVHGCEEACGFHAQLVHNMLAILAQKNVSLTQKMEAVTQRTIQDKLLVYLSQQARSAQSSRFAIPFNRQQLADYLAVERSALSRVLAVMQSEGLLRYHKNEFELLQRAR